MEALDVVAGLAWDPEIRGFMAVFAGVVVMMGSVWLLLATNTGARLGTLLTLAGFFGWIAIMATIWWIYGIGWTGSDPIWELQEINVGDLQASALDDARSLTDADDLPSAYELVLNSDDVVAISEFGEVTRESMTAERIEGMNEAEIVELMADEQSKNEATTLSELAAVAPDVIDDAEAADIVEFGGWTLLSTAEAGEAQASAIALAVASPDLLFAAAGDFKVLDAYTTGGKRGLPDDPDRLDRIWTQIRTAFTIRHPTRYGIVQIQQVEDQTLVPGQPPPRPVVDDDTPVISVIMVRNLGNLRLKPALLTIGSFAIFVALCLMLHERDKLVWQRRAEFEEGS